MNRVAGLVPPGRFSIPTASVVGEFWRYLLVSLAALGVDVALLYALTSLAGVHYLISSAISYSTGAIVSYVLCVTVVFGARRLSDWRAEFAIFFLVGLFGLAATQVVLKVAVEGLGLNYLVGKIAAVGVSFILNFLGRKALLFTMTRSLG